MVSFSSQVLCFFWSLIHAHSSVGLSEDMHGCALLGFPSNMLVITSTKVRQQHTHPCSSSDQTACDIIPLEDAKAWCRSLSMFKWLKVMALYCM